MSDNTQHIDHDNDCTYNGYPNRATYLVALWIDSDEGLHHRIHDAIAGRIRDGMTKEDATRKVARAIESAIDDVIDAALWALDVAGIIGLAIDLLEAVAQDVDYDYIAQGLLCDFPDY